MADVNKSRRGFLSRLLLALGGLAGLEAGWVATTFFGARREVGSNEQRDKVMVAGPVDRFQPGSVTPFRDGEFYLARLEGGGFLALHRKCTHTSAALCPGYRMRTGSPVRAMRRHSISMAMSSARQHRAPWTFFP